MRKFIVSALFVTAIAIQQSNAEQLPEAPPALVARVVAVGIPGAGAVSQVGAFHPGGPIRDKPEFFAFTEPGRILHSSRILVASSSNFGAPIAQENSAEGSIISIHPDGPPIVVPMGFAKSGSGQASAMDGRVQLFTAQSPAFLNSVTTPQAVSASQPSVSNPLGISINNAFGRLWFSSAPGGPDENGLESIVDPGGMPLAGAPSKFTGGVFFGDKTNRPEQMIEGGLRAGAVANALVGMSPDGSKRAVFAVLTADGAIAQAHTEFNLDGLAPRGTIRPIALKSASATTKERITRAGMIFNWVPDKALYVTEPGYNAITALTLGSDEKVFRFKSKRTFSAPEFNIPVDLSPVIPEIANPVFSSNTTLAGGSDMYVANRGNGTVVRMRQDGTVVGVRRITLPDGRELGAGELNGIAVSPDAQRIWLTTSGALPEFPDASGALLEVPAFGPARSGALDSPAYVREASASDLVTEGTRLFLTDFSPEQGLGPLFNRRSCVQCHLSPTSGGMGWDGLALVQRVGHLKDGRFDPLLGSGGPVARQRSIADLGVPCDLTPGPPSAANLVSLRNAPPLYGLGLIDMIPDEVLRASAAASGTRGRLHITRDSRGNERIGRYGWKADTANLEQFVAEAFRNELGITSPLGVVDKVIDGGICG